MVAFVGADATADSGASEVDMVALYTQSEQYQATQKKLSSILDAHVEVPRKSSASYATSVFWQVSLCPCMSELVSVQYAAVPIH